MDNKMTFGMCLKFLLTTYNIRMSQLAKAINVDSSLVNKWVHEKRIPSDSYINTITEFLAKIKVTPMQIKLVEELMRSIDINHSVNADSKEKIEWILRLSLDHSLRVQNKKRATQPVLTKPFFNNSINLSEQDKLIYDIENIYHAFLSLLDLAAQNKNHSCKRIYLTYHNNFDQPFFTNERLNILKHKLLQSIQDNWEITFLLRLDSSIDGVIKFIHFVLPLIKTGSLKLFYITNYESFITRKELYIVTGLGALSCFPSDPYSGIRCAFFLRNLSAVDVFSNYANLLIENNSNDIIEYYKHDMNGLYFSTLTNAIDKIGDQYSYNNSFSKLLIPQNLYLKFIHQTDLSPQDKELSFYYYKKQFDGFYKNLQNHIYMDIYFISILDKLCEEKILYLYTYSGIKIISMEIQDIIEFLEYVINIITTYSNYHIAIVTHDTDDFVKNITLTIKERQMMFLDVFERTKRESDVRLSISDPMIVKAFVDYYKSLWNKISPLNKDKSDIILLIQDYIKTLKNELLNPTS